MPDPSLRGAVARLRGSRSARRIVTVAWAVGSLALGLLVFRHLAASPWPFSGAQPAVIVAVGVLLVLAQAFKAYGWGRLFATNEQPEVLALAAANGGAALAGMVLPGRCDDAMRVIVVRRFPRCPAGVRALCLSLVLLGLIDSVALAPLAGVAAVFTGGGLGVRAALVVVSVAGIAAAALVLMLPRLAASRRARRLRLGRWLDARATPRRRVGEAWALVSACWAARVVAMFLLLGTLGLGFSLPLALLLLCAGAAAAALPIGPAGAATQIGAGAAALVAAGVGVPQALAATLAVGALGVMSGAAIFVGATAWRTGIALTPSRIHA